MDNTSANSTYNVMPNSNSTYNTPSKSNSTYNTPSKSNSNRRRNRRRNLLKRLQTKRKKYGIRNNRTRKSPFKLRLNFNVPIIDTIITDALTFFKRRVNNNQSEHPYGYAGLCGTSQSAIYWSSIKNGIHPNNIKLLNAGTFVLGAVHAFAIIKIKNEWYICDLSFKQFIFNDEEVEQLSSDLDQLYRKYYVLLTKSTIINYFKYCTRQTANYIKTNIPNTLQYIKITTTNNSIYNTVISAKSDMVDNSCRSTIRE
jgi:hypothetical protein